MTIPAARHREESGVPSRAALVYLSIFVLVLLLLPSTIVLPGSLKSNGSPAVVLALASFGVVVLEFIRGRRPAFLAGGVGALCVVGALELVTWASGEIRLTTVDVQAGILRALLGLIGYIGIGVLVMMTMQNRGRRRALIVALVVGIGYDGVVGIVQSATSSNPRLLLEPPGFVLNRQFVLLTRLGHSRATGTADSPIEYALLMAILIALSLYLLRRENGSWVRALGGVGFLIGVVGLPASVSRTGVVAIGAVAVIYLIVARLRSLVGVIVIVAGVLAIFAVVVPSRAGQLVDLFTHASSDDSITGRTTDYPVVFHQFHQYPFFGAGLGSNLPSQTRYLDNQWLQALVEGGIIGVAAFALLFLAAATAGGSAIRLAINDAERSESVAFLASMAAAFVASFTFDLYAFNQAKYVFFVLFGLCWASVAERQRRKVESAELLTVVARKEVLA